MKKIIFASNNQGKLKEINQALAKLPIQVKSLAEFSVPEVPETAITFAENAILKARHAAWHTQLPAFADDSGLVVDALEGRPGIHSKRYAGTNPTDEENIQKLLADLQDTPQEKRAARFHCCIAYLKHAEDPIPLLFQGTWEGIILTSPQGHDGFGYDPIFYIPTHKCSAAQLSTKDKNAISHRGQALQAFAKALNLPRSS